MSIQVKSETQPEAPAALSDLAKGEVTETQSAPADDQSGETAEESETSEATEGEENTDGENDESDADESNEERPKKRNGVRKRIDKLRSKLSAKEQEVEYWREQALKGQRGQERTEKPEARPAAQVTSTKPNPDEFESHDDYLDALIDWKAEQKFQAREAKLKEAQVKTEFQKQAEAHVERVKKFVETHDDFKEVLEEVDDIPVSPAVEDLILASENGPELMYELAKNREEFKRICSLPAVAAARELGKFEAKLAKGQTDIVKQEPKTTKAPPPIKPIGTGQTGTGRKSIFDPNLSQSEYERLRREQQRKNA